MMADSTPHQARAIGEKLREVRQEQHMSLRELANKAEISASMLSQIETGKVFPSVRSLYSIATVLGVSVDYFFPDQENDGAKTAVVMVNNAGSMTASELRDAKVKGTAEMNAGYPHPEPTSSPIVHANARPTIELNGGVTWSRLTAHAESEAEFLEINYAPGAMSGANMSHHEGREFGLVLEGELVIELGFDSLTLKAGDSIILESTTPHRLINKGTKHMRAVWVVLSHH
jgi:transcriptional regulator with XRE-family HTH domain/quercetin dioxygenase-like cupin family protein